MATKNINGTYTSTYVLTSANPSIYFEPTNSILTTNQTGVYGAAGTLWSVSNAGVIGISGVTHHSAVSLKGGGSITNDKGGEITAFGTYAFADSIRRRRHGEQRRHARRLWHACRGHTG